MTAPAWVTWAFTTLVILLALGSIARLGLARLRREYAAADVNIAHALMGIAMAGMLMPRLSVLPSAMWLAVFAAGTTWFTWQAVRSWQPGQTVPWQRGQVAGHGETGAGHDHQDGAHGHPVPHAVECLAMVYMLLAAGPLGSARQHGMTMPGMTAGAAGLSPITSNPVLALLLCVLLLGSALWTVDKLTSASANRSAPHDQGATAPRLASYSKIGMSLAMGYALLTMI
jgi:hypothetical protein